MRLRLTFLSIIVASIVLEHALANGNCPLVEDLMRFGVGLTLEHVRVALQASESWMRPVIHTRANKLNFPSQIGYELPGALFSYIEAGGLLKYAFDSTCFEHEACSTVTSIRGDAAPLPE